MSTQAERPAAARILQRAPIGAGQHRRLTRTLPFYAAVGALLGLVIGLMHYLFVPPQYEAKALVFVVPATKQKNFDALNQIRWSQALARIAADPTVSGRQLRAAGFNDIAEDPKTYISTSAAPDAAVYTVTVRDSSATRAREAATIVARATAPLSKSRNLPVTTNIVPATLPRAAGPRLITRLILGGSTGLGAGCLAYLIRLDRTANARRASEDEAMSEEEAAQPRNVP